MKLKMILEDRDVHIKKAKDLKSGDVTQSGAKILSVVKLPSNFVRGGIKNVVEVSALVKGQPIIQFWPAEGRVLCRRS